MHIERVGIQTRDGLCPAHVLRPQKRHAALRAVLFYMDAGGIRPAVIGMVERLAAAGYLVLLPDLFYRYGPYDPLVPADVFDGDGDGDGDGEAILGPLIASTDNARAAADTWAFISYLEEREDVAGKLGAVGFCMGGAMALTAAAVIPSGLRR